MSLIIIKIYIHVFQSNYVVQKNKIIENSNESLIHNACAQADSISQKGNDSSANSAPNSSSCNSNGIFNVMQPSIHQYPGNVFKPVQPPNCNSFSYAAKSNYNALGHVQPCNPTPVSLIPHSTSQLQTSYRPFNVNSRNYVENNKRIYRKFNGLLQKVKNKIVIV